jgi:hypothetical protein
MLLRLWSILLYFNDFQSVEITLNKTKIISLNFFHILLCEHVLKKKKKKQKKCITDLGFT